MEKISRVSAFRNYYNFSDIVAERPKSPSENSETIKSEQNSAIVFPLGVIMIMLNEESERVHQVVRYIHSPAFFLQRDK